jgi:rhodanese-related sulfurtransferase
MSQATITPDMTMEAILQTVPSAQRALFQRYHVGGCSSCAFQPTDTLAQVCKDHNILDVQEVVRYLLTAKELDEKMQVPPAQVAGWLAAGEPVRLIDVREPGEVQRAPFAEAEPLDYSQSQKYLELPKDTRIVFACQNGDRSLDVAAYFVGHGFTEIRSLAGGLDAWRAEHGAVAPPAT